MYRFSAPRFISDILRSTGKHAVVGQVSPEYFRAGSMPRADTRLPLCSDSYDDYCIVFGPPLALSPYNMYL